MVAINWNGRSPSLECAATSGNVVDYGAIEERIRADSAVFDVREIACDP